MMPPARPLHRPAKNLCFRCQNRLLQIFSRQGTGKAVGAAAESESESKSKPAAVDPRRNPLRLTRVIGVTNAPAAGENTGSESRTWRQRKSDWINHEKNRQEREELYVESFPEALSEEGGERREAASADEQIRL